MSQTSTSQSNATLRRRATRAVAAQHAGQMTAAMRALSMRSKPRVLRIALVRSGSIIEERIIKDLRDVTVGSSAGATFAFADADLPASFTLFQRVKGAYHLQVIDGMRGRIAIESGITDLAVLFGRSQRSVKLSEDARGKIVLGTSSLVFQFVEAPVTTKPQLPISIRTGLGIDWNLTVIAAMSFLVHFGLVGAMYSDLVDPVVDQGVTARLIDDLRHMQSKTIPIETRPSESDVSRPSPSDAHTASPATPRPSGLPVRASTGAAPTRAVTATEVRNAFGDLVSVLTPT